MSVNKLKYHLMPRKGWLNDPNGLVYFKGHYHIFYQADEDDLQGRANKSWGHYSTKDFVTYTQHDLAILPDSKYDQNGAYSGSAIVKEGTLYLFYTGNVKHSGNYDYIHLGREHNLMRVESKDGIHFENKKCILKNDDYPSDCTNHVRDPKIFVIDGKYHLVLGARLSDDTSCVLEYISDDLESWTYFHRYTPNKDVGFMIECPEYIQDGSDNFILCSPQGLQKNMQPFQNVYDTGYYRIEQYNLVDYQTLDYGFDFYAPQTFYNTKRQIMIAWIGMPDNQYFDQIEDWNQTLSLPRMIDFDKGEIKQRPIDEVLGLRKPKKVFTDDFIISKSSNIEFEVLQDFSLHLNNISLIYEKEVLCLDLSKCNCKRSKRYIKDIHINNMSIFIDESVLEIFINDGRYTMTSRFYDSKDNLFVTSKGLKRIVTYEMRGFEIL